MYHHCRTAQERTQYVQFWVEVRQGGDVAVECLPDIDKHVGKEPAMEKAEHLTQETRYATAQADFRQQRSASAPEPPDSTVEAKASTQSEAVRKTA